MPISERTTKGPGPEAGRVKLSGDWKKAVGKALKKERPKEGWTKDKTKSGR